MAMTADSFQRCCRLCAEEQEVTIMLFSEEAEAMLLKKKLNKYLLIEVDEDDKLPKNICVQCCSKLQSVCEFIDKAIKAQEILHKQIITLENKQSQQHQSAAKQNLTLEEKHNYILKPKESIALQPKESITLQPIKTVKVIKQEPDSDDDLKFATMEISVDPMMVLQNSEDHDVQSPDTVQKVESDEDVTYLHGVDGEDVTIKLIKRSDQLNCDIKPFPCITCKRGFHTEFALKNHSWVHNEIDLDLKKPFKCGSCGDQFDYKNELVVHLKKHDYTSGICLICGRRFRTEANLAAHMAAHSSTTGKSYTCKVCGRSYNTSSNLKTHSVTHSNERPYKCQYCKKCFKRNQDLKFHTNQHTGEKPYKCPFCEKCFASSGNCYSHKSRMHPGRRTDSKRKRIVVAREKQPMQFRPIAPKPAYPTVKTPLKYQCTFCDHSFLKRDNFTYHMYQHTGEKPFHCSFCNEKFVTRRGLLIHHDKTHPGKDRPLALISRNVLLK